MVQVILTQFRKMIKNLKMKWIWKPLKINLLPKSSKLGRTQLPYQKFQVRFEKQQLLMSNFQNLEESTVGEERDGISTHTTNVRQRGSVNYSNPVIPQEISTDGEPTIRIDLQGSGKFQWKETIEEEFISLQDAKHGMNLANLLTVMRYYQT